MAIPDPLTPELFADVIPITGVSWQLSVQQEFSGLGSGQIIAASLAPSLWRATVTLAPMYHADAADVQALIESLDGSMRSFYLHAPQKPYPRADPKGAIFGASTPTIHTLGVDNKSMRITGVPSTYVLSRGDFLAFNYGSPSRRAFHRIMETVTAVAGLTPSLEVRPHIRPGVVTGASVILIKPAPRMIMVPGSFNPGNARGVITDGMSFEAIQKI